MPFVALDAETGERIDITKLSNPRAELKPGQLVCQACEGQMMLKAGPIKQPHFAHYASCTTEYNFHPESPEHLAGKLAVAKALVRDYAEYTTAAVEFEVRVPEVMRIADIMVTFPNGWRVAHEVQLASIGTEQLERRTNDYARAGVDVFWWLGRSADTESNRKWCYQRIGFVPILNLEVVRNYRQHTVS